MGDIRLMLSRFKELTPQKIETLLLISIKLNENILIDYNTSQLMWGLDSEGRPIDPIYASANYAEMKLHLNPRGVVDLKLTGKFHNSIFITANDFPIIFKANDPKAPDLLEKYGSDILGVPRKNLTEFVRYYAKPELQEQIRGFLRLW